MSRERITATSFTLSAPGGGESLVGRDHHGPNTTRRPAERERLAGGPPPTPAPVPGATTHQPSPTEALAKRLGLTTKEHRAFKASPDRVEAFNTLLADGGASDATLRAVMRGLIHPTALTGRSG